ncbi:hypothetical protein [Aliikangiella sp. IMCC44632]
MSKALAYGYLLSSHISIFRTASLACDLLFSRAKKVSKNARRSSPLGDLLVFDVSECQMRWCMVICWDAVACGMSDVINSVGIVGMEFVMN